MAKKVDVESLATERLGEEVIDAIEELKFCIDIDKRKMLVKGEARLSMKKVVLVLSTLGAIIWAYIKL